MNDEHVQVAMPKLYGASAYARPPVVPVAVAERPFDPDDLPLESERTREEHELATTLQARPYSAVATAVDHGSAAGRAILRGRAFRLRLPGGRPHEGGNAG